MDPSVLPPRRRTLGWYVRAVGLLAGVGALLLIMVSGSRGTPPARAAAAMSASLDVDLSRASRAAIGLRQVPPLRIGVQLPAAPVPGGREILVGNAEAVINAMRQARAGDLITLAPGTYGFAGHAFIDASQSGTAAAPITVRASLPGSVRLEFAMAEGFKVSAPYWIFENLDIRGVCPVQAACEHAFHVVGKGGHFVARNNRIADFNAHFKINLEGGFAPDDGLLENNTLSNQAVRQTDRPVAPIDLVGASHWIIRANLITDFIRAQGDRVSHGAFAKGGGAGNRFERNVVLCEYLLHGYPGQRVGLSLGGGGTGPEYCRDKRCDVEQDGSVIDSNLIVSCSDEGIYLNHAAASRIVHNTLLDTAGIMVRYPGSTADINANLVDGPIRSERGALVRASDNLDAASALGVFASHPVRGWFIAPDRLDLRWRSAAPPVISLAEGAGPTDLCGRPRVSRVRVGAFDDFAACLQK